MGKASDSRGLTATRKDFFSRWLPLLLIKHARWYRQSDANLPDTYKKKKKLQPQTYTKCPVVPIDCWLWVFWGLRLGFGHVRLRWVVMVLPIPHRLHPEKHYPALANYIESYRHQQGSRADVNGKWPHQFLFLESKVTTPLSSGIHWIPGGREQDTERSTESRRSADWLVNKWMHGWIVTGLSNEAEMDDGGGWVKQAVSQILC